jgi:hypothetical protein
MFKVINSFILKFNLSNNLKSVKMKKRTVPLIIFYFILITCNSSFSQNVKASNIYYTLFEEKYHIWYDLPENVDSLNIRIAFYKKADPGFEYYLKHIAGDVGIGKFSGSKNKIIWDYKKEPAFILAGSGSGINFKVFASVHSSQDIQKVTLNNDSETQNSVIVLKVDSVSVDTAIITGGGSVSSNDEPVVGSENNLLTKETPLIQVDMNNETLSLTQNEIVPNAINCKIKEICNNPFIPGSVQLYNNQKAKGWGIIGAETITILAGSVTWYLSNKEYNLYQNNSNEMSRKIRDQHLKKSENYGTVAIASFATAGGIYLYSLADAFWFSKHCENRNNKTANVIFIPQKDEMKLCLLINF